MRTTFRNIKRDPANLSRRLWPGQVPLSLLVLGGVTDPHTQARLPPGTLSSLLAALLLEHLSQAEPHLALLTLHSRSDLLQQQPHSRPTMKETRTMKRRT